MLAACDVPWVDPLGRAVVDALEIARDAGSYPWSFSGVMGLAERCLDPAQAPRLDVLTAIPDETERASPGAGGYWSEAFQRLVSTLRLRAAMGAELEGAAEQAAAPEPEELEQEQEQEESQEGPDQRQKQGAARQEARQEAEAR